MLLLLLHQTLLLKKKPPPHHLNFVPLSSFFRFFSSSILFMTHLFDSNRHLEPQRLELFLKRKLLFGHLTYWQTINLQKGCITHANLTMVRTPRRGVLRCRLHSLAAILWKDSHPHHARLTIVVAFCVHKPGGPHILILVFFSFFYSFWFSLLFFIFDWLFLDWWLIISLWFSDRFREKKPKKGDEEKPTNEHC